MSYTDFRRCLACMSEAGKKLRPTVGLMEGRAANAVRPILEIVLGFTELLCSAVGAMNGVIKVFVVMQRDDVEVIVGFRLRWACV